MKQLGLIVNPIAGMGGPVGLKGTDGVLEMALLRGAVPGAALRVKKALAPLCAVTGSFCLLTCSGDMGMDAVSGMGFDARTVYVPQGKETTAADTIRAAKQMREEGADLILFAGGDGTAADICRAVADTVPVLGIPAGVKIHSPVYALNPAQAGELARQFLLGNVRVCREAEVIDIDENAYRNGQVTTRLCGYLSIPFDRDRLQNRKTGTPLSEKAAQHLISLDIIDHMLPDVLYIIGPGTTTRPVMENLGLDFTLLGVDLVMDKRLVQTDVSEQDILGHMAGKKSRLIITPTGGQGSLLGRGNQQISPKVLSHIDKASLIVAATKEKIFSLCGRPLCLDTGDPRMDLKFSGYIRVITGYKEELVYPVR